MSVLVAVLGVGLKLEEWDCFYPVLLYFCTLFTNSRRLDVSWLEALGGEKRADANVNRFACSFLLNLLVCFESILNALINGVF